MRVKWDFVVAMVPRNKAPVRRPCMADWQNSNIMDQADNSGDKGDPPNQGVKVTLKLVHSIPPQGGKEGARAPP